MGSFLIHFSHSKYKMWQAENEMHLQATTHQGYLAYSSSICIVKV